MLCRYIFRSFFFFCLLFNFVNFFLLYLSLSLLSVKKQQISVILIPLSLFLSHYVNYSLSLPIPFSICLYLYFLSMYLIPLSIFLCVSTTIYFSLFLSTTIYFWILQYPYNSLTFARHNFV